MRHPLQRHYGKGDLHFITFSCYQRQPLLGTPSARNLFFQVLDELHIRHEFLILGYVVMPEHVHLLIGEPRVLAPSKVLQVLKQNVSKAMSVEGTGIRGAIPQTPSAAKPAMHAFWQRRFYDFNVWSDGKVREKLDYMHANPVTRGLVMHPKDWPWSSWSYYVLGSGLIRMDFL
jgi:putative transposase